MHGFFSCPQPPDWRIDWSTLDTLPFIREMRGCPQHPVRHAEGDVWTHVHMVCEAMVAIPAWRELPEDERELLFTTALLHDVSKPACTRTESNGEITSRGHSWKGAIRSRQILWRRGVPFLLREQVCAMVRHHLVPFYLVEHANHKRLAIEVSQTARCDHLSIMAEADARGRTCPDPDRLLDHISFFRLTCEETGVLREPFPFLNEHARFLYFRDANRQPDSPAHEEFRANVVLLSGLPGSGKDHWLTMTMPGEPVISLDALRHELGVSPSDPQGEVLNKAREMARVHLRAGESFVWNATNLSRQIRNECIRLFADYNAHIRIVYVEAPVNKLFAQNRMRKRKVPEAVIERLLDRWEVPDTTEAHRVEFAIGD